MEMMTPENQYLSESLTMLREALTKLPEQYATAKRTTERQIDELCEKAGIMSEVESLRNNLEATQKQIQKNADLISGRIQALEEIFNRYHYAPIPKGMTHMYGIELEPLDPETRLRVMEGNPEIEGWLEAIAVLGGDPNRRDWDGTEEPKDVAPTRLVPPSTYVEEADETGHYFLEDVEDDDTGEPFHMDEDTGDYDPNLEAIRNLMGNEEG
jgi:hypothetical protein